VERSLPRSGIDAAPVGLRLCATVSEARRRAWNGSFVPRFRFTIRPDLEKCTSDLQVCRAAYRNRTDDLRITRDP
jgi:hypothetical protein